MKQNIIITGGAGYVGTSLCESLNGLDEVESIVVYDELIRNDRRFFFGQGENTALGKVRFVRGDILDTRRLSKACRGMNVMVHLAAFVDEPFTYSQHTQYDQVNAYGALSVTRALEENPQIQRLIHLSSSAVYGFREGIDPSEAPNPQNGYALSKRRGEQYLEGHAAVSGVDLILLRAAHIFGYNRTCRFDTLVHRFAFEALTGGRISLYGSGNQVRPFVALDRVVEVLRQATSGQLPERLLIADFQCELNAMLAWIRSRIPAVEYQYLTPAIEHPSQSFAHLPGIDERSLNAAFDTFQRQLSIGDVAGNYSVEGHT
jgi:UDP-glucose 4-epimerase